MKRLVLFALLCGHVYAADRPNVLFIITDQQFAEVMSCRMVRTERYKYCIHSHGQHRESLVDFKADPGETKNLAGDPKFRKILLEHRALLAKFAKEHSDRLVPALLADNVKPIPFTTTK